MVWDVIAIVVAYGERGKEHPWSPQVNVDYWQMDSDWMRGGGSGWMGWWLNVKLDYNDN